MKAKIIIFKVRELERQIKCFTFEFIKDQETFYHSTHVESVELNFMECLEVVVLSFDLTVWHSIEPNVEG